MPTYISKINGLDIQAAQAQYIAGGNVDGAVPLATSAETASYISPTFISASAAASGFGSGGGAGGPESDPIFSAWSASAASKFAGTSSLASTASYSTTLGASIANASGGRLRLFNSDGSMISQIDTLTASLALTSSLALTALSLLGSVTSASFASTASYLNNLNQNLTINGNLTVFGTASYTFLSASSLNVSNNTISVNVFEPQQRFGGLVVFDSGSSAATASFLWDSLNNKWIYQNVSGSGYDGGMAIFGPRNSAGLGNEQGTTNNALMKGQGGDHITSSRIFDDGTNIYTNSNVQITGSLTVTSNVIATASWATNAVTASYSTTLGANLLQPTAGILRLRSSDNTVLTEISALSAANSITASYVNGNTFTSANPALSASYALTASYALSSAGVAGGVTSITAGTGISVNQSTGNVTITNTGGGGGGTNLGLVYAVSLGYLMP